MFKGLTDKHTHTHTHTSCAEDKEVERCLGGHLESQPNLVSASIEVSAVEES